MRTLPLLLPALLLACSQPTATNDDFTKGGVDGKGDSSALAVFLDFEFDGSAVLDSSWNAQRRIESQLFYTVGQLNGENSVGRLDRLELSNIQTEASGGQYLVTYHAKLLVAWGDKNNVPDQYTLRMPRDISYSGLDDFTSKYSEDCVDWSAHDVTASSMWYYYRPDAYRCDLADEDVVDIVADLQVSEVMTTGKYPEYDRVWEDDALRVVAIFGKNEADVTSNSDAGISAYNTFTRSVRQRLGGLALETLPASIPNSPGVDMPDTTFRATLPDGKTIEVVALLVDGIRLTGPSFESRYEALTPTADLIAYNGHSGLGANIRALAQKGDWATGQYSIVFMNGCDTYAYVDSALFDAHAAVNPGDPKGTQHLDMVMNAMPSYFHSNARGTMAMINGLLSFDEPETYENIFTRFDSAQVVLVSGEEDNTYVPGGGGEFEPIHVEDAVGRYEEQHFSSGAASPGVYIATLSHDPANPGGDADLYTRVGAVPTTSSWDCRPYAGGSSESCRIVVEQESEIFLMVRGWSQGQNHFVLDLVKEGNEPEPWAGMEESGAVARYEEHRFVTPELAAGSYLFEMTGSDDADLYVRVGMEPTTSSFGCRPYKNGSNETCQVELNSASKIHLMVRGYANNSSYSLVGSSE